MNEPLPRYGCPLPLLGVTSDITSSSTEYDSMMVMLSETFSPDSTGMRKTNRDDIDRIILKYEA